MLDAHREVIDEMNVHSVGPGEGPIYGQPVVAVRPSHGFSRFTVGEGQLSPLAATCSQPNVPHQLTPTRRQLPIVIILGRPHHHLGWQSSKNRPKHHRRIL